MNGEYKILAVFAAGLILTAAAQAQDGSTLSRQGVTTNSAAAAVTLDVKAQPTLHWADHTQVSGLFVDLVRPQETWNLLNPVTPAPTVAPTPGEAQLQTKVPVPPSDRDSNVQNRGPNFAVLRFSFP
jgi:hypothetical protein